MSDPLTAAVRALLRRLHAQKPLRGGSLIVTIFGDAISPRGGVVTLGSLIRIAGVFGLTERLVRTSVARLAKEGWLLARKEGRQSEYRLTRSGEQRFAEATRRIYGKSPESWDGRWTLVILPPGPVGHRGTGRELSRARARGELRWLGFGQLSPGTFAHPNCTLKQAKDWLMSVAGVEGALCVRGSSDDLSVDRELAALGWDLGELTRRYGRFLATFEPVEGAVGSSTGLEPKAALIIRTLLIHQYRKIHLQDPLLPATLLPPNWVGSIAYEVTRRLYSRVFESAERFLSANAGTVQGPLPPATPSVYDRFAGALSRPSPPERLRSSAETGSRAARPARDDRWSK